MGFLYYLHSDGFSTCRVSVVKNTGVGPGPPGPAGSVLAGPLFRRVNEIYLTIACTFRTYAPITARQLQKSFLRS